MLCRVRGTCHIQGTAPQDSCSGAVGEEEEKHLIEQRAVVVFVWDSADGGGAETGALGRVGKG